MDNQKSREDIEKSLKEAMSKILKIMHDTAEKAISDLNNPSDKKKLSVNKKKDSSGEVKMDLAETKRQALIKTITEKLNNTTLQNVDFNQDGYGQFRSSYSKTERISLMGNARFKQHFATITQLGLTGSSLDEKLHHGEWQIICNKFVENLPTQRLELLLKFDNGTENRRVIEISSSYIFLSKKRYDWFI